jgi:ribosomal protein S12 methylthiotransferase accessory factor
MLYFGYPFPEEQFFAWGDSNGNAAGNTLEEAIAQGFFELVERDAVALWWYNRLRRPAVDLSSFDDPYIGRLVNHYASLNREVWALDLTSDLGIPVVAAISRRTDRAPEEILFAFGAHFDPHIAVVRALTEMNQFLPAVVNVDRDGRYAYDDPDAVHWWKTATLEREPYLVPADGAATRIGDWVDLSTDDTADDVRIAQRIVEDRGLEFLVLDQTRPDIGLPVARVVVPGLRHFWARLGPGRLYDVPVELGWLPAPRAEDELNPIGIFV